ncbi:MAG: hypothetical protein ACLFT8_02575 [Desulfovermiculus sp.]
MSALSRAKLNKKKKGHNENIVTRKKTAWPERFFSAISPDHGALFEKSYGKENMLASMEKNPKNM